MTELTVDDARRELAGAERRVAELQAELLAAQARANQLRMLIAADLQAQARALLDNVQTLGSPLTGREFEVARARAMSDEPLADIARRLNISLNTAKTHVANVYRKLGVSDVRQFRRALKVAEAASLSGAA